MCVLRVVGKELDVQASLLASGLEACSSFKAGEPRRASKPDGALNESSGFNVSVSDADMSELQQQIDDACSFLARYETVLRSLSQLPTVEDMRLDFPIELRIGRNNVAAQFDYFPPRLVRAAGALGIGLELSVYPCSD